MSEDGRLVSLQQLFLWPHAGCNARCVMCDIWRDKSRRELDVADVARWADEWHARGLRHVTLTGGEALMHSDLWALCAALRERGMSIGLLTTGITLARHASEVAEHCTIINVSLDGPPEIHDLVRRVPRAFARLADGVAAVRARSGDVRICGRSAVHQHNYRHLRQTLDCARDDLGLDRLSFSATDLSSDAFNRPDGGLSRGEQDALAVPAEALPDLENEVEALIADRSDAFAQGFMFESPDKLRRGIVDYYRAYHGLQGYPPVRCTVPWASAVIEVDGTVRPCFFLESYGKISPTGTFDDVLNSAHAREHRRSLDVATNEICRRCVCSQEIPL